VIERCIEYLSQLSMILNTSKLELRSFVPMCNGLVTDSETVALSEPSNPHNALVPQVATYSTEFTSPQPTDHTMWSNMDLGEFMMDNDLDLLGRVFNFSQAPDAGT
jgi:hypothetical protein